MAEEKSKRPTRKISLVWQSNDVKCVRPDLDSRQCGEVLEEVLAWHDCTLGVTWETLEFMAHKDFPLDDATGKLVDGFIEENGHDGVAGDLIGETFTTIDRLWKKFVREHRD